MYTRSVLAFAILAGSVAAKNCRNITVSVSLSVRDGTFNIAVPSDSIEVADFVLNVTQQGRNFTATALAGYHTQAGVYNISAMFCKPSVDTSTNPTVQVLTHGIGFDRTYWALPYHNYNYSYIDVATDIYKYCTVSYDRLGIGNSTHGDSLNEIQSFLEVAALHEITMMLRHGTFPTVPHAFDKIVHVGHSFGSIQTYSLVNQYPKDSDGIVLTGFSFDLAFVGLFVAGANFVQANRNQPKRFGKDGQNLPDGYLVNNNAEALKYIFLKPSYYPSGLLNSAEDMKQPVTLGEILTLASVTAPNPFSGPVLVFNGDSDLVFCGSDCFATGDPTLPNIPAGVKGAFPRVPVGDFESYIQPNMGHGINLHYNSTAAYRIILDFLNSKNLKST